MNDAADFFIVQIARLSQEQAYFVIGSTAFVAVWSIYTLGISAYRRRPRSSFRGTLVPLGLRTINWPRRYGEPKYRKPFLVQKDIVPRTIMNQSEMNFYAMLAKALPHHTILAQVSFNALITHGPWLENRYYKRAVRSKFNTKYVDFVICTKQELTVYAVVEYDGGGHNAQDDWTRDEMLRSAGYRVERFTSQDSAETILARFG